MANVTQTYRQVAQRSQRDELILSHLSLVRHVLGRLGAQFPPGVDLENLESAGVLGLVEAAANFVAGKNTQFKTYAYIRVRGAILDELRRNCPLPQQMLETAAKVRAAHKELPAPVSVESLAAATGLTQDEVTDCLAAIRMTRMVSYPAELELGATRLDDRQDRPDALAQEAEGRQLLADAIEALPARERIVVTLYYREDLRLKEISKVLALSESRISRILNAGLFNLGEYMRGKT